MTIEQLETEYKSLTSEQRLGLAFDFFQAARQYMEFSQVKALL